MKNILIQHGDLLKSPVHALVNTVNCVGVMGKGIALQFHRTFPFNSRIYEEKCQVGEVRTGQMLIVPVPESWREEHLGSTLRYIINFPTKQHWRSRSQLEWIRSGLSNLVEEIKIREIESIALPPLGCGNGGLDWEQVQPLIETAFRDLPQVQVWLYPPEGAPKPQQMAPSAPPRISLANALYLYLLERYSVVEMEFSALELQKLAYFLHVAGQPKLRLSFETERYGPYAPQLRHVLQKWEGHWITGFGDGTGGAHHSMTLLPHATTLARDYLAQHAVDEDEERLRKVTALIEGFDSAFGLELLASTHWVAQKDRGALHDVEQAIAGVRSWSAYKRQKFPSRFVRLAWHQLHEQGWLDVHS